MFRHTFLGKTRFRIPIIFHSIKPANCETFAATDTVFRHDEGLAVFFDYGFLWTPLNTLFAKAAFVLNHFRQHGRVFAHFAHAAGQSHADIFNTGAQTGYHMTCRVRNYNERVRADHIPGHFHTFVELALDLNFKFCISCQSISHYKRRARLFNAKPVPVRMHYMLDGIFTFPFI